MDREGDGEMERDRTESRCEREGIEREKKRERERERERGHSTLTTLLINVLFVQICTYWRSCPSLHGMASPYDAWNRSDNV